MSAHSPSTLALTSRDTSGRSWLRASTFGVPEGLLVLEEACSPPQPLHCVGEVFVPGKAMWALLEVRIQLVGPGQCFRVLTSSVTPGGLGPEEETMDPGDRRLGRGLCRGGARDRGHTALQKLLCSLGLVALPLWASLAFLYAEGMVQIS